MRNTPVIAALLIAGLVALTAFAKDDVGVAEIDLPTARGVALKASLHKPAKSNGAAIVLAPGQGYHKELPLMKRSAEALTEAGFTVIRFDWAYFTAKGEPSEELAKEVADVDAVMAFARKQEGISKVLLAGKSLGSVVTIRWGKQHSDDAAGFALLTPPMNDYDDPTMIGEQVSGFEKLGDSALLVVGDRDPLCDLQVLYRALQNTGSRQHVVIVPGDHSFVEGAKDSPETLENVDLAVRNLVVWAKRRIAAE